MDREDIAAAVGKLERQDELATARALVERRLRRAPAAGRCRRGCAGSSGMLARKGYPAGLAFRVVREALERGPARPKPDSTWMPSADPTTMSSVKAIAADRRRAMTRLAR